MGGGAQAQGRRGRRPISPSGLFVRTRPQGGGDPPPPPLLQAPKWLYGTMGLVGTGGAADFVLRIRQGEIFCLTLCVYTQNTQNFVENSKMDEKHKKRF